MIPSDLYHLAQTHAIRFDLAAMGRLETSDRDRLDLINRLSTNQVINLQPGQGCATVFTTSTARIRDWVVALNRGENALVITGHGRANAVADWLRRNIFWNDRLKVEDKTEILRHIGIFGPSSAEVVAQWWDIAAELPLYHFLDSDIGLLVRVPMNGFWIIATPDQMEPVIQQLDKYDVAEVPLNVYDALRIEAGLPEVGHELTEDYIPLEIGLWNAVSFNKGCYTGQEIIARMESRGKLAKMMVRVQLDAAVPVGTALLDENGKTAGTLTSIMTLPDGNIIGLAVVRATIANPNQHLRAQTDDQPGITIVSLAGHYQAVFD